MTIHNRTPHPITILAADAPADSPPALELPAAGRGQIARVETTAHTVGAISVLAASPRSRASERTLPEKPSLDRDVAQIDVVSQRWGRVVGLADTDEPQVVSAIVAAAMQTHGADMRNVYVPADQVRNDKGQIVGCRGLLRGVDAVPRLGVPPQVVVFGSALTDPKNARDLDVAYCGMDPWDAARIAREWAHEHRLGRLELDLRRLPTGDVVHADLGRLRVIEIPRPAPLPGDDVQAHPLDSAATTIFGSPAWVMRDHRNIPARLRRAERLLELHAPRPAPSVVLGDPDWTGSPEERVLTMLLAGLAEPHVLVLCEDPPLGAVLDGYDAPTVGAVRRACARLERRLPAFADMLVTLAAERGVPGPWHLLWALRGPRRCLDRIASRVCQPGSAAGAAPAWQRTAGRLTLHGGYVGSEYGQTRLSDRDAADLLG